MTKTGWKVLAICMMAPVTTIFGVLFTVALWDIIWNHPQAMGFLAVGLLGLGGVLVWDFKVRT
jgi:hypothetical protein